MTEYFLGMLNSLKIKQRSRNWRSDIPFHFRDHLKDSLPMAIEVNVQEMFSYSLAIDVFIQDGILFGVEYVSDSYIHLKYINHSLRFFFVEEFRTGVYREKSK